MSATRNRKPYQYFTADGRHEIPWEQYGRGERYSHAVASDMLRLALDGKHGLAMCSSKSRAQKIWKHVEYLCGSIGWHPRNVSVLVKIKVTTLPEVGTEEDHDTFKRMVKEKADSSEQWIKAFTTLVWVIGGFLLLSFIFRRH